MILKHCALFNGCISTLLDNAKDFDAMMPMYNLLECSDNYSKTNIRKFIAILST